MTEPLKANRPTFRRSKFSQPRLAPEEAARQGAAASHAFKILQDRDRVLAFLNGHDESLGGRPIDIAIASDEGLAAVTETLDRTDPAGTLPALAHSPAGPTD